MIRNAGGRASDDAIRSLVISYKLLGTREWFVIHHTDCGMEFFSNDAHERPVRPSLETAALGPGGSTTPAPAGLERGQVHRLAHDRRHRGRVVDDVQRIRSHPLVPGRIPIYGYLYDVKTGKLIEIPAATGRGRAARAVAG